MERFPPTIPPRVWTLSSMIIGYALIDSFTANEQNAIGNWLMTMGQILEANAAFQQTVEERFQGNTININSQQYKNGGSPYMHNKGYWPRDADNSSTNNGSSGPKTDGSKNAKRSNPYKDIGMDPSESELEYLERIICVMQKEIENIKRNLNL